MEGVPGGEVEETEEGESDDTGDWSGSLDVDTGENARHLTLPGTHHEQPGGRQQGPVDSSEGGAGHEDRHDPGHAAVQSRGEGHRHRLGAQHLRHRERGVEGDDGEEVDEDHDGAGDGDGPGEVPDRVLIMNCEDWRL